MRSKLRTRQQQIRSAGSRLNRLVDTLRWVVPDPAKTFWLAVGVALSFSLLGIGGSYAFTHGRNDPALHVVSYLPGGLCTHGWLLIVLALANIWALGAASQQHLTRRNWMLHRWTAMLTVFYTGACAFVELWFPIGSAVWLYALAFALSLLMLVLPPPLGHDLHNKDQTADGIYRA